jgi:ATP phosphoribosyltransferase
MPTQHQTVLTLLLFRYQLRCFYLPGRSCTSGKNDEQYHGYAGADIQFTRSHRLDVCLVRNHNLALVFLPAADIPRFVGEGNVDLGITGQDMVAEASASEAGLVNTTSNTSEDGQTNGSSTPTSNLKLSDLIEEVLPLGFGSCKLQIQVPERSTHIKSIEDLVGKKIATSFDGLSNQFFKELDAKVNAEREAKGERKLKTKIEYVGGSVEAACALGVADGIVDLVGACLHPLVDCLSSFLYHILTRRLSAHS